MNLFAQHCFLLDGKTILPINNHCQYSDKKNDQNEKYLITRFLPSINLIIDSPLNENNQSPSAMTIIIKPLTSSENHRKDTSIHKKSSLKKRKNSSSSSSLQRLPNYLSDKIRLSTFKDQNRFIPATINFNKNSSSNILHSRTLLNAYRHKKQSEMKT